MIEVFVQSAKVTEKLLYELTLQIARPKAIIHPHEHKFLVYVAEESENRVIRFLDKLKLFGTPLRAKHYYETQTFRIVLRCRYPPRQQLALVAGNLEGASVYIQENDVAVFFSEFPAYEAALKQCKAWIGKMGLVQVI